MPPSDFNKSKNLFKQIKNNFPLIIISTGFLLIFFVFIIRLYSDYHEKQLLDAYKNTLSDLSIMENNVNANDNGQNKNALLSSELPDGITVIGLLTIPKINLVVPIGEGVSDLTMQYTVAHFQNTALPGQAGNCVIAGHRNYLWGEHFNRLDELEVNDKIVLSYNQKNYTYTVTNKQVVNPEDIWVLDQTSDPQITLITCTPIRIATQRLIVNGTLTQIE
jgi:LPXTG-site transpeptidase (sortase) family protein